jgi:hypothetical protein
MPDLSAVAAEFAFSGRYVSAAPCGNGHINDTYCVQVDRAGRPARFVLQRINHQVFRSPHALMENVERVTSHLARRVSGRPDAHRRVLTLIPTRAGLSWHEAPDGNHWRAFQFVEQARTVDCVESTTQAYTAARAFGEFQSMLADLPAPRLHDTIPDFHHTPGRFAALEKSIQADGIGRAGGARAEIEFALARAPLARLLLDARLPERVTHNDAKINNVMLDEVTGEGLCVVDLDTVMPGLALYDFGDLVRTTTSPAAEDERDLSRVAMELPMFEALVRGYLESAGGFLTRAERQHLACAGKLITFETGIRFLTDHLDGDRYFKIHREGHNLDRCRTQFRLVESIERQEDRMIRLVESIG